LKQSDASLCEKIEELHAEQKRGGGGGGGGMQEAEQHSRKV
jgi:hypothetical protein